MSNETAEYFKIEYTVKHIIFRNEENGFTIFKVKNIKFEDEAYYRKLEEYTLKGTFEKIDVADTFRSNASWVCDTKYGQQISLASSVMSIPSNANGIKRFLTRYCRGIGKATASKIVKMYGTNTLDKIRENAEALTVIKGISKKKAQLIYEQVIKQDAIEKLSIYLFSHGINNFNDVVRIYEKLGDAALDNIKANPYCLCRLMSESQFFTADKIALSSGYKINDLTRLSNITTYYLSSKSYSNGNMFERFRDFCGSIVGFMNKYHIPCDGLTHESFYPAIKNLMEYNELIPEQTEKATLMYLSALYKIETGTAEYVKKMLRSSIKSNYKLEVFFKKYEKETGFVRDGIQEEAVQLALSNGICLLSGGPGTGKTQTINEILAAFSYFLPDYKIALCSPTGRAAKRISHLTGRDAYTLHRLLGITADNDFTGGNYELNADYIICDEASMIDASLFYKLVKACYDNGAGLLLVGDKNQLPPVGAGLPFRDLINSGKVPAVTLKNLFRQAKESQIVQNAEKVLSGMRYPEALLTNASKQDFYFYNTANSSETISVILNTVDALVAGGTAKEDIIILSSMHKTPLGCDNLNLVLQEHLNPPKLGQEEFKTQRASFRVGDRVMQTVNNYELNVFNGDVGAITRLDTEEGIIEVSYEDYTPTNPNGIKTVEYSSIRLSEITLAYSVTVHKSQGSEYPCVIMPLHQGLVNLSRNILYTAITRAKSKFFFIGDIDTLYRGIERTENVNRNTYLKERLVDTY